VERRLDDVARQIQRRASLPGFRKGKVPLDLVRQHFADTVEQEFLEKLRPPGDREAVDQARLNPVVPPWCAASTSRPDSRSSFEALVDVRPEIEVRDYRGLPARKSVRPVDEAAVGRVLEGVREESGRLRGPPASGPAGRHRAAGLDPADANGRRLPGTRVKARRIPLGSPEVLPDLENALLGAEAGQERTFEIHYPAEYPSPDLAGTTQRYVVNVRKIQEKKLRDLDDNLAREVFKLESLEELRSRIRPQFGRGGARASPAGSGDGDDPGAYPSQSHRVARAAGPVDAGRVIHEATEGRPVDETLHKELGQRYREGVERSLRRELLLAAVARQESSRSATRRSGRRSTAWRKRIRGRRPRGAGALPGAPTGARRCASRCSSARHWTG